MSRLVHGASAWVLVGCVGCGQRTWETCEEPVPAPVTADVTWHRDVRPIVESRCQRCHEDGGPGPFTLSSYEEAVTWADASLAAVDAGEMPPWLTADCCDAYRFSWDITADERELFRAWVTRGTPEGDPSSYVAPNLPSLVLPRVDATLSMEAPFLPELTGDETDATHCFLLDWPIDHDTFVTGIAVKPGNAHIVHHATVLVAGPSAVKSFEAMDALSKGDGWSCPGGIVLGYTGWLGGWSPGWGATEFPDGVGHAVPAGSKVILSVHYSVTVADPEPDQSAVEVMVDDAPASDLGVITLYDPLWLTTMRIPAGETDVVFSHRQRPAFKKGASLMAANLHLHERGSWGQIGIEHADGTTDCLVQVNDWDYEWQNDYWFAEPKVLQDGDRLYVECHFDNGPDHQRVVDGVREAPRDLRWAEDGEMCVGNVTIAQLR